MSDQYVGEIRMFAGNYPPKGWAFCDGAILPITGNESLYSIIGVTYGGDGTTNFKLPDLKGRLPLHKGTNSKTGTEYTMGQTGGTETVALTLAQLPAHTHAVNAQSAAGNTGDPANAFWAASASKQYSVDKNPTGLMNAASVSSSGASNPHNNLMPYLPVSFIIALQGLYPTQG
ncbi:phage tail protein [Paenibacillus sp. Marseille-Q7038]